MTATKVNVDIVFPTLSACRGPHTRGRCCTHTHFPLAILIADPLLQHKILWLRHTFSSHALLLSMITVISMIIIMISIFLAERLEFHFNFFTPKTTNSVYCSEKHFLSRPIEPALLILFPFRTLESPFSIINLTFSRNVTTRF